MAKTVFRRAWLGRPAVPWQGLTQLGCKMWIVARRPALFVSMFLRRTYQAYIAGLHQRLQISNRFRHMLAAFCAAAPRHSRPVRMTSRPLTVARSRLLVHWLEHVTTLSFCLSDGRMNKRMDSPYLWAPGPPGGTPWARGRQACVATIVHLIGHAFCEMQPQSRCSKEPRQGLGITSARGRT